AAEVGGVGDHGGERRPKKRALGLEDHGQLPPELQSQVQTIVQETKRRSGWPVRRTLRQLDVSPASYYRWRKEARGAKALSAEPVRPVQAYEATDQEKQAVRA